MRLFIFLNLLIPSVLFGQNYTSYFTGNTNDILTNPTGGICLMGGAGEDDQAMKWFLQNANGGDILVLRTTGSDGYNNYLYSTLGITVNSVETIVCHNAEASDDPYVLQKIEQAEAIWFAGGDQWDYISYWRDTPIDSLINLSIVERNIVIGGLSAGMAIQGKYYYSAENGSVTSATALANPFHYMVTVDSALFIQNSSLNDVITDTHFDNPDRRGRLMTFLARIYTDYGIFGKAIACDEYTAVCIETDGIAKVYGGYPTYNDNAYFVQTNCELSSQAPEVCISSTPLTWNLGGVAIKVFRVKGSSTGSNTFNLNDWETGIGGQWLDWSVNNGVFSEQNGNIIDCGPQSVNGKTRAVFSVFPNPTSGKMTLWLSEEKPSNYQIHVYNSLGQHYNLPAGKAEENRIEVDLSQFPNGLYYLTIQTDKGIKYGRMIVKI